MPESAKLRPRALLIAKFISKKYRLSTKDLLSDLVEIMTPEGWREFMKMRHSIDDDRLPKELAIIEGGKCLKCNIDLTVSGGNIHCEKCGFVLI